MKERIYKAPEPIEREEAIRFFATGTDDEILDALLSVALYDEDWKWSQEQCLHFINHANTDIRRIAALGLGHIARIHRNLDRKHVVSVLNKLIKEDKNVSVVGTAEDALDDINMFMPEESDA